MNTTFQLGQATQDNAALELPSELLTQLKSEARASKKTAVALIGEWLQQRELETAQKKRGCRTGQNPQ